MSLARTVSVNTVPVQKIRSRRVARRQRGAAAVEFALVLPILMTVLMGAIDWGWFFYIDQLVTNAAREGARAGSVVDPSGDPVAAAKIAAGAFLDKVKLTGAAVDAATASVGGSQGIQVTVTYPVGSLSGFLTGLLPDTAHATSVMRWP